MPLLEIPRFYIQGLQEICKMPLNDEWDILFVRKPGNFLIPEGRNNSVEIHRQNTDGKLAVYGLLKIVNGANQLIWERTFSRIMNTGDGVIQFDVGSVDFNDDNAYWLDGCVYAPDNCENCENGRSKESNHLKCLEGLSNHLERLLDPKSSCFSDVTLKCGSASIPAHKIILSARSPVFAAMFSHPMKESHKNEVDVSDMDISVIQALLLYMYTGKTNDLSALLAEGLLFAADKYQLEDLKSVCCDVLKDSLSLQNVLRFLVIGELLAVDLKSFVVDYICKKSAEFPALEKSEEWKTLRKDRPELAVDVLSSMVNYKNKN